MWWWQRKLRGHVQIKRTQNSLLAEKVLPGNVLIPKVTRVVTFGSLQIGSASV